jgi:hypothetical protein
LWSFKLHVFYAVSTRHVDFTAEQELKTKEKLDSQLNYPERAGC